MGLKFADVPNGLAAISKALGGGLGFGLSAGEIGLEMRVSGITCVATARCNWVAALVLTLNTWPTWLIRSKDSG